MKNLKFHYKSSTYSNIQNKSNEIWNFQYYKIVYEYDDKVFGHLPPPFNPIGYIIKFLHYTYHCIKGNKQTEINEYENLGKNLKDINRN